MDNKLAIRVKKAGFRKWFVLTDYNESAGTRGIKEVVDGLKKKGYEVIAVYKKID